MVPNLFVSLPDEPAPECAITYPLVLRNFCRARTSTPTEPTLKSLVNIFYEARTIVEVVTGVATVLIVAATPDWLPD